MGAGGAPPPKLANRLLAPPKSELISKPVLAGAAAGAAGCPNEANGFPPDIILEKSRVLPGCLEG